MNSNPELVSSAYAALTTLKAKVAELDVHDPDLGICANAWYYILKEKGSVTETNRVSNFIHDLMCHWPKSTGSAAYPVPDPKGGNSRDIYDESDGNRMWYSGEYAALRIELLDWLIDWLEDSTDVAA